MGVTYLRRRAHSNSASANEAIEILNKPDGSNLAFLKGIYERLGSLTDNKSITTPTSSSSIFEEWLLDMNDLWNSKYYPGLYIGDIPSNDLITFDAYLGTLGLTDEYPFTDSTYNLKAWLEIDDPAEMRVLVDESDNTYLVDGTDVLVKYN